MKTTMIVMLTMTAFLGAPLSASANGLGEGRSYQFRTDSQRSVFLTLERSRLELLGLLGNNGSGGSGGGGGGTGQTGNASSIIVNGSNNTITVNQTNSGNQSQTRDCTGSTFSVTGGMFGC